MNKNEKKNVKKGKKENNARPIVIEESTIIESNYIITPIYEKEEFQQKLKNNKQILYDSDVNGKSSETFRMKIYKHSNLYFIAIDANALRSKIFSACSFFSAMLLRKCLYVV